MSDRKSARQSFSSNQSASSLSVKKTSTFPLPNATKPRYVARKKLEVHDLPDDVLLTIFRLLSPIDLLNVGTVCRRWYSVSQDESLWYSLVLSYGLHQQSAPAISSKHRIQAYLNNHVKRQVKRLFPVKFDVLTSYTGIPDFRTSLNKSLEHIRFLLAFCDEKHNVLWTQPHNTMKLFDTSMSVRWFDLSMIELLSRVRFLRLFVIVSVEMNTRPNRLRLPTNNEQLADVTQQPVRHMQKIRSLLHEYPFEWSSIKSKSSLSTDKQSPIQILTLSNNDDLLIATYDKDKSFCFLAINLHYLSFHEAFLSGLGSSSGSSTTAHLSQVFLSNHSLKRNNLEVSVFISFRNLTTIFLRHRFLHCRLLHSNSSSRIELIRNTDMSQELGPELEQLPKFNWKTDVFQGTFNDLFLIDLVVLNESKIVTFAITLPATLIAAGNDSNIQGGDSIISSNVWNINAQSQSNNRIRFDGTIMRLDSEYCALGRDSHSWHLQQMTCSF